MKARTFFSAAAAIAMAIVIYVARHDIADAWRKLPEANPWLLLLMIPTQLLGYHANARMYERYFEAYGNNIAYRPLYRLAVELNFVNHVFPSGGLSGASFIAYRLKHWGISTAKATLATFARFGLLFASFQVMLLAAMVTLIIQGGAYKATIYIVVGLAGLFLFGGMGVLYIISSRRRIVAISTYVIKTLNSFLKLIRVKSSRLIPEDRGRRTLVELNKDYIAIMLERSKLLVPGVYALVINLTEVLTIYWVYLAFGQNVNLAAVTVAFGVANVAGALAAVPGGIGVYESLMTVVMVSSGVPAGVSLSVTVVYRVINMSIFIPAGYVLYHRSLLKQNVSNE